MAKGIRKHSQLGKTSEEALAAINDRVSEAVSRTRELTPEAIAKEMNDASLHGLAMERGAIAMRLACVELVERRGLPALALEIAQMKVKL